MGRYRGPVEKLSRREGVQLYLKGSRVLGGKSALERRPYPPGERGRDRQRPSEYRLQLREKQKAKRLYGLRERQFRRLFDRSRGALLRHLELRLDNVLFRVGFAATRAQARQFVVHGHVLVNGGKVDIPSFRTRPGDVVSFRPGNPIEPVVREATDLVALVPRWLLADHEQLWARIEHEPAREEIDAPVDEQLVVEFYSR